MYTTGIAEDSRSKATLFRAADGKRKALTPSPYGPHLMRQMMKRRLEDAGLPELFSPHSFRVTVVTDLLNQNIPLEDVQYLAGHSSPTTMRVYDSPSPEGHAEYRGEDFDLSLTRAQASEFVSV